MNKSLLSRHCGSRWVGIYKQNNIFKGTKIKHKMYSKAKGGGWGVIPEVARGGS